MAKLKLNQINLDDDRNIYLRIDKARLKELEGYYCFIDSLVERKRAIPKRVFTKFIDLFVPVQLDKEAEYNKLFDDKFDKLKTRFVNDKRYRFTYKKRGAAITTTYSLESMLEDVLHTVLKYDLTNENTKEKCLDLVYTELLMYRENLDLKRKKFLLPSKISAISAYILILFGFSPNQKIIDKINAGDPVKHAELFKSVWHHTQHIKIKKA